MARRRLDVPGARPPLATNHHHEQNYARYRRRDRGRRVGHGRRDRADHSAVGFINNRAALRIDEPGQVIADRPDIVFVTMGLNDNFSYDTAATQIHAQIGTDLRRLRAELPDTRLIVVEPFWYTDERPTSLGVIIGWVEAAASAVDADYIPSASRGSRTTPSGWARTAFTRTTPDTPRWRGGWMSSSRSCVYDSARKLIL